MWKKSLLLAAGLSGFLFEEGNSCGGNNVWLFGALGLGALLLLGGRLGTTTNNTAT